MRDSRFNWNNLAAFRHQERQRQEEQALLDALPDLASLREGLRTWWQGLIVREPEPPEDGLLAEAQRLSAELSSKVDVRLTSVIEALVQSLTRDSQDDVPFRVAKHLLAEEVGRATARGPVSVGALLRAGRFVGNYAHDWMAFREAFVAECTTDAEVQQHWARVLEELPELLEEYLRPYAIERPGLEGLREEEAALRRSQDPTRLWERRPAFIRFSGDISSRMRVLAALEPSALLRALEHIPSALMMREMLEELRLEEDREWILRALRETAPVFNEKGWTGKRALLPWVEAILGHAVGLERAVAQAVRTNEATLPPAREVLEALHERELPSWFQEAFGVLLSRKDGQRVAIEFAAWLAQDAHSTAFSGTDSWPAALVALQAMLLELEARSVRLSTVQETMSRLKRKRQMPFFLVGCGVESKPDDSGPRWGMRTPESREAAWQWYERMLAARDEGILQEVNPYGAVEWPFRTIGDVLAGFEDPVSRWQATWGRLFKDRQAARFRFVLNSLDPSLHLVRTGFGAIESLLSEPSSEAFRQHARPLWRVLMRSLQYLVLGQAGTPLLSGPQEMARAFAYLPHVFGTDWAAEFSAVAPLLQSDEVLALRAAYLLLSNGIERQVLWKTFAQHQMDLRLIGKEAIAAESHEMGPEPPVALSAMFQELLGETSPSQ